MTTWAAKQFDLTVYRAQLALLRSEAAFAGLKQRICDIASLLEELPNVPMVAAEMSLIVKLQTEEFWRDVTLPALEKVRRKLGALVKLIEFKKRPIVYSDFEDRTGSISEIEVRGISIGTDMEAFHHDPVARGSAGAAMAARATLAVSVPQKSVDAIEG
jgi:type I restriction enzyme, R subunit